MKVVYCPCYSRSMTAFWSSPWRPRIRPQVVSFCLRRPSTSRVRGRSSQQAPEGCWEGRRRHHLHRVRRHRDQSRRRGVPARGRALNPGGAGL